MILSLIPTLLLLQDNPPFVYFTPREKSIHGSPPFIGEWASVRKVSGTAKPGEFFVYQVGVSQRPGSGPLSVSFSPLRGKRGSIGAGAQRCISLGGIDYHGHAFHKNLLGDAVLWCGIDVPADARGVYRGTVTVHLNKVAGLTMPIQITVIGKPVADHGAGDAKSLARLRWLDSTAGQGTSITKPYLPIRVKDRKILLLGRELHLDQDGLPARIVSHFSGSNTHIVTAGKNVLASPMKFVVDGALAGSNKWQPIENDGRQATWRAEAHAPGYRTTTKGRIDFTGSGQIAIHLTAERDMDVKNISLEIPYARTSATYMMGLNRKGGLRPASHEWTWDVARHQDCFWIGDVNAGLMVRLKDQHYRRPLVNIYYSFLPLLRPDSWGTGGVRVFERGGQVIARCFTGPRRLNKGQSLDFIADIYLTPFRTIDTDRQWSMRFDHPHPSRDPKPLDDALAIADPKSGSNVINVHQATYYNPYINYPYSPDSFPAFTDFVRRAHKKGVKARVYYTTREITQNMPELFALHSLSGEVVFPGPGKDAKTLINPKGPNPWLDQNLGSNFIPAWVDHVGGKYADLDLSVITTPDSRWNNFYLEGLKWMVDKAKIDGVYIDDTALDASSLQRARRILSARPDPIIDLHTWNHFNQWAGYANNLNMYMEVLPYLDRLWLGEGFNANEAPWDYWLVEMSGLPFGLMSEMLDGPNTARGLVFGETGRLGWSGDPRPIWAAFDRYGIHGTEMIPFFDPACPVKTDDPRIKATVYKGKGYALVALASWADSSVTTKLSIDAHSVGFKVSRIFTPAIPGLQEEKTYSADEPISVSPRSGFLLILKS